MEVISPERARELLVQEADQIRFLIKNQQNKLCLSHCKAFEEVVDTQTYGLSRQVSFAIRLGVISSSEGQQLLSDLERDLNQMYSDVYIETKKNQLGKEV